MKGRRTRFGSESATQPNKRVQRTRLRSPLTRHPLGGRAPRFLVAPFATVLFVAVLLACQARQFETCTICGSTREISSTAGARVLYQSPTFAHGPHDWRPGISKSVRVSNGSVVLARRQLQGSSRPIYGAFILTKQTDAPERVSYRWLLLSDGPGPAEPSASRAGEERDQRHVTFGEFNISWSSAGNGQGYLYYAKFAHQAPASGDTYLCVTSETTFDHLDAADPKWLYKFSPAK